jgi:hypothetical protein
LPPLTDYWTADEWDRLLGRIERGKCTPFLGAGASAEALPLGSAVARQWAEERGYPLWDADDLAKVAQFLAVVSDDAMTPKEEIQELFERIAIPPDFSSKDEPYAILADLPLPIFLTTNYDDFIVRALRARGKDPVQDFCRWTDRPSVRARPSVFDRPEGFDPTPERPLVYHLHGLIDLPESLVLTEDDYVDFLVNIASADVVPPRIREALADSMLVFLGYRIADWNFRVLYRGLVERIDSSGRRLNMTVQLQPQGVLGSAEAARDYLERYYHWMKVRVFWGDVGEFMTALREHRSARGG